MQTLTVHDSRENTELLSKVELCLIMKGNDLCPPYSIKRLFNIIKG